MDENIAASAAKVKNIIECKDRTYKACVVTYGCQQNEADSEYLIMPKNAGAWIKQKSSQKRKKYRTFFGKSLFDKVKSFSEEISKILRLCSFRKVKFYSGFLSGNFGKDNLAFALHPFLSIMANVGRKRLFGRVSIGGRIL